MSNQLEIANQVAPSYLERASWGLTSGACRAGYTLLPEVREGVSYKNIAKVAVLGYTTLQLVAIAAIALKYAALVGAFYLVMNSYQKQSATNRVIQDVQGHSQELVGNINKIIELLTVRFGLIAVSPALQAIQEQSEKVIEEKEKLEEENEKLKQQIKEFENRISQQRDLSKILSAGFFVQ